MAAPIPSPEREPGWYWVRLKNKRWVVARMYHVGSSVRVEVYRLEGSYHAHRQSDLAEIGPRIPSPDERPAPAAVAPELVARLRELDAKATPGNWMTRDAPYDGGVWWTIQTANAKRNFIGAMHTPDVGPAIPDEQITANAAFIVALVNAYRAGLLAALEGDDAGWREGVEAAAKWHEQMARAAAPHTGNGTKHEWYAEQIRALQPPSPPRPAEEK